MLYPIELRARAPSSYANADASRMQNETISRIIEHMSDPLYLHGPQRLLPFRRKLVEELRTLGLEVELGLQPVEGAIHVLVMDVKTSPDELYADVPWLKEQFDFSSLRGFRLMPFLVYDSNVDDVENLDDEPIAETLEEVISGEFKPYGYDRAKKNPLEEFPSVLEEYDE